MGNNSINRTSSAIAIQDLRVLDWWIVFNSKYYLEIDITFNTNLNKIISDYSGTNASGTSGNAIIIDIYDDSNNFVDTTKIDSISLYQNILYYPYNQNNSGFIGSKINDNKLTITYDFLTSESGIILSPHTSPVSLPIYNLKGIIHDGDSTEKTLNFSNMGIRSPAYSGGGFPGTISPYIQTYNLQLSNMKFNENDVLIFSPSGDGSKGMTSSTSGNIIDKDNHIFTENVNGDTWNSTADFVFEHTTAGTSGLLTTDLKFSTNNGLTAQKIVKYQTDDFAFGGPIFFIVCLIDNDFDNTVLDENFSTSGSFTLYTPILKDYELSDNVTQTLTFSNFTGSFTGLNGVADNDIVNQGESTFNVIYPAIGATGTANGQVIITTDNGMQLVRSVSILIV